ncbi:thiol-activated cytolysin family protein [Deinococcus aquatilis]|uniref:thiol-activated cytolysin family protein n=1 Tax=Deinococcus aquatilis TaxID=519440 RepID=UPI0003728B3F|nr:thiol-activated cytolysin family protein [Deinococcus aquatilis]
MSADRTGLLVALLLGAFSMAAAQPRLDPRLPPLPSITPAPGLDPRLSVCNTPSALRYPTDATSAAQFVELLYGGPRREGCPAFGGGWPAPSLDRTRAAGSRETTQNEDGRDFSCRVDSYDITRTPDDIVTFDPDAGLMWPGALLQGEGVALGLGSLRPLSVPASQRMPVTLSLDLLTGNNRAVVVNPSNSTVAQAVGSLVEQAQRSRIDYGSSVSYKKTESYSLEQSALALGLDAAYLGASVRGRLSFGNKASEHSVTAFFIQKAFTVSVGLDGQRPGAALLGNRVPVADLVTLAHAKELTYDNLPTYVSSVTYGRVLMFRVTSAYSASEMQAALDASYQAVAAGGRASFSAKEQQVLNESRIEVVSVGGPFQATAQTIRSGSLSDYFKGNVPLTSFKPISYVVRLMSNNAIAAMSRTTQYNVTICTPNPIGIRLKPQMYVRMIEPNDADEDSIYGNIRVNGTQIWEVRESQAADISRGETVNLYQNLEFPVNFGQAAPMRVEGRWIDDDWPSGDDTTASWDFTVNLAEVADAIRNGQVWERHFRGGGDDDAQAEIVIRFDPASSKLY